MAITDIISDIQTTVGALAGIRSAPSTPEENFAAFPFVVAYPSRGRHTFGGVAGERLELTDIVVELHFARNDLPRNIASALTYHESIPNALMADSTLGATVDTFERIDWTFGGMTWGELLTIGYRFTIVNAKIRTDLT